MLHFTECTPTHIQVPGILKIGLGDRLYAALRVEPRSYFIRDGFLLDKAVFPSRLNSLFIKLLGVQFAAFDSSNLGCDQCRATFEILRTVFVPDRELLVVGRERL